MRIPGFSFLFRSILLFLTTPLFWVISSFVFLEYSGIMQLELLTSDRFVWSIAVLWNVLLTTFLFILVSLTVFRHTDSTRQPIADLLRDAWAKMLSAWWLVVYQLLTWWTIFCVFKQFYGLAPGRYIGFSSLADVPALFIAIRASIAGVFVLFLLVIYMGTYFLFPLIASSEVTLWNAPKRLIDEVRSFFGTLVKFPLFLVLVFFIWSILSKVLHPTLSSLIVLVSSVVFVIMASLWHKAQSSIQVEEIR
ncbi:MAG: hypothetical protein JW725_04615 [Candidatus Babeliaceae bacterium]|nr:hypothetical protein [Candidatus Babeliaceae bacterium]